MFRVDEELLQVVRRGEVESRMVFHFKDGSVLDGTLELPPDVYNGMVLTVAKNLPKGASETVHYVAFTPTPRLIQLALVPKYSMAGCSSR